MSSSAAIFANSLYESPEGSGGAKSREIGEGDGPLRRVGDFRVLWPGDRKLLTADRLRPWTDSRGSE